MVEIDKDLEMNFNTTELLKSISPQNTAFVVGNGINLFGEETKENGNNIISWSGILKTICKEMEITDLFADTANSVSFPEIATILNIKLSLETDSNHKKDIKQEFSNRLKSLASRTVHRNFIGYAKLRNIPVMTTNFDTSLIEGLTEHKLNYPKKKLFVSSSQYIWNYCYNNNNENKETEFRKIVDGFGVWFMHGNISHRNSIKLNFEDYANSIAKVKKLISGKSNSKNVLYSQKKEDWVGRNTWLHHFFHRDLVIIGLALDTNEVFLRWLLLQRFFYQKKIKNQHNTPKTWYIYSSQDEGKMKLSKEAWLKTLNIYIIHEDKFTDIYNSFKISNKIKT